jgi:hypothetical protein
MSSISLAMLPSGWTTYPFILTCLCRWFGAAANAARAAISGLLLQKRHSRVCTGSRFDAIAAVASGEKSVEFGKERLRLFEVRECAGLKDGGSPVAWPT